MKFEPHHHPAARPPSAEDPPWATGEPAIKLEGARKEALETGRNRLVVTGILLALAFATISGRLVELAVFHPDTPKVQRRIAAVATPALGRSDIVDRNGMLLATTLPTASIYVNPSHILDASAAAEQLARLLPDTEADTLRHKLRADRPFVWLKRNLTPKMQFQINALGIPGVYFRNAHRRVYPHGAVFSHALGLTDIDGHGISGVERYFERRLSEKTDALSLSLDHRVQSLVRSELSLAIKKFSAIAGAAVVMDVQTGEVLALVSLPDFDPNQPSTAKEDAEFNRVTKGVYEMGSTFKLLTTAMALDSGAVKVGDRYDARTPIRVARFTIRDYHAKNRWLSVPEILIHSSNIGAAKMAIDVGTTGQRRYLKAFGLLNPPKFELPEIGAPLMPKPWREISTMTIAFGHGIAVSPLQLAAAVGSVVNGGVYISPTIAKQTAPINAGARRVISAKTSATMRRLMRQVVLNGTGRNADVPGYPVGGKTGTADKPGVRGYGSRRVLSSFVGVFPIATPKYLVLAMIDEPKGIPETHGYATGGWVAAPVVGNVIKKLAPLYGLAPVPVIADDIGRRVATAKPIAMKREWPVAAQ